MKLERIQLKRFGCFRDLDLSLSGGFNAIVGGNESGKSTLIQGLLTALFIDPAGPARFDGLPGGTKREPYLLHLEYEANGQHYRLTKDVATEITLLEEVETGTSWNDYGTVQRRLAEALGMPREEFFTATACIRQGDVDGVSRSAVWIKDRLEKLLNHNKDEALASGVLDRIAARVVAIAGEDANGGRIAELESRIADWTQELDTCKSKTNELVEIRRKLYMDQRDLQAAQNSFDEKHEAFRKSKLAFEAAQALDKEREAFLELGRRTREAQEIKNAIGTKKDRLKSLTRIERADLKSTESLAAQTELSRARVQDLQEQCDKAAIDHYQSTPRNWYKYLALVALAAAGVCAFFWYRTQDLLYIGAGSSALIVCFVSLGLWISARRVYTANRTLLDSVRARLEHEQSTLAKGEDTLQALLRRFKVNDVDQLAEAYDEYRDLDRDIKGLVERYEALLQDNNLKDLEVDLERMSSRMAQQQQTFEKYRAFVVSEADLEQLQRDVSELDKRLTVLREENETLRNKVLYIEAGSDLAAPLEERILEAKREIEVLRDEAEQLAIIDRYLEEARRKVLKSSFDRLEEESANYLQTITAGVWRFVRIDRQTLACEISRDGETWMSVADDLSRGTSDAAYLALRLSVLRILFAGQNPLLVCEDPLVNLDSARRNRAIELLREFSADSQVIFLTADTSVATTGDAVTELAPSATHAAAVV